MTDREVMQQALDALEMLFPVEINAKQQDAYVALREALAHIEKQEASERSLLVRSRNLLSQPPHWVDTPENAQSRLSLSIEIAQHLNGYTAPPAQPTELKCDCGQVWKQTPYGLAVRADTMQEQPPAAQKPLTDEQIENLMPDDDTPMSLGEAFMKFARLVEAAHGITSD